jgi:hypothetical protein
MYFKEFRNHERSVKIAIEIVVNAMTIRESIKFIISFCVLSVMYTLWISLAFFFKMYRSEMLKHLCISSRFEYIYVCISP